MDQSPVLARRSVSTGTGVIALRNIEPGECLVVFTGPVLRKSPHREALSKSDVDYYLQISATEYLGPSGGLDDFVNHSCEPNCGLQFSDARIHLVSLQHIAVGEEVSFDYATTQNDYPYRFRCHCGAASCRSEIGDFDELPMALKRYYHDQGMLAPWLADRYRMQIRRPQRIRQATSSSSVFSSPE